MTKIEKAIELYEKLRLAETHVRVHTKLLIALPRRKRKHFEQLLANANLGAYNARNAFQVAAKKLTREEFDKVHHAVYV